VHVCYILSSFYNTNGGVGIFAQSIKDVLAGNDFELMIHSYLVARVIPMIGGSV